MTTALQIVNGAAEEIGVKTAEIDLEPEDSQKFFERMNDMLTEWADIGLTPGFNEVFDINDDIDIDRNANSAVKFNLAIRCAPSFQKLITPSLTNNADSTFTRLQASTHIIGEVALPDTLPIGSGNQCPDVNIDRRFFNTNKKENF
jgi:hypothetical protein